MKTALIAAYTLLSISSPSNYYFSTPVTSNLTGKTYVLTGGRIPRAEDIAFLREAYFERAYAICPARNNLTNVALNVSSQVPGSLLFGEGLFHGLFGYASHEMFPPSTLDRWGPYTGYDDGFFLKRGISNIQPDFEETGPDYIWSNGQDTSFTNTIRAWITPANAVVPSNKFENAELAGILSATNSLRLFSSFNTNAVNSIIAAYSIITNQYNVLSIGVCWSHGERKISDSIYKDRYETYQYSPYTYTDVYGQTISANYASGHTISDWDQRPYVPSTNDAPFTGHYEISGSRTRISSWYYRRSGGSTYRPTFDLYQPWDEWDSAMSTDDGLASSSACGNALATCPALDRALTNAICDVKCFLVCRFMIVRTDKTTGRSVLSAPSFGSTNYFVSVLSGDAARTGRTAVSPDVSTNSVWNTGVQLLFAIDSIVNGYDYRTWAFQASTSSPSVSFGEPIVDNQSVGIPYARRERKVSIYLVDVYPYFYYRRKWNARLPAYDPD